MSYGLWTIVTLWPGFGLGVVYLPIVHYHVLEGPSLEPHDIEGPSAESHLLIGP
jgi:hypothetical protein